MEGRAFRQRGEKDTMMTMELAKEIAGYALAAIGIAAFAMMAFCNLGINGKDNGE